MSKANTIRKKALDLVRQQDWANAIKEYRRLVELDQNNPNVHNELADLYLRTNQKNEAFESFMLAIDEYTRVGLFNNAVAVCKKVIRVLPARVEVLNKLGLIRMKQGLAKEAESYYLAFLEKAAKRREAGTWTDHDHRCRRIGGHREVLLRILDVHRRRAVHRPPLVDERRTDAEALPAANHVRERHDEQVRFIRMAPQARRDRIEARLQRAEQRDEFRGGERRSRCVLQHVQDVVDRVAAAQVFREPRGAVLRQERREAGRPLRVARLEQPPAHDRQFEPSRERVAERHALARAVDRFAARGAHSRQDGIDQRIGVGRPDAERVPRRVGQMRSRERDDVMLRLLRGAGPRQPNSIDPRRGKRKTRTVNLHAAAGHPDCSIRRGTPAAAATA